MLFCKYLLHKTSGTQCNVLQEQLTTNNEKFKSNALCSQYSRIKLYYK